MWSFALSIGKISSCTQNEVDPCLIILEVKPGIDFNMMKSVSLEISNETGKGTYLNFASLFKSDAEQNNLSCSDAILEAMKSQRMKLRIPTEMRCTKVRFFHLEGMTVSKTFQL